MSDDPIKTWPASAIEAAPAIPRDDIALDIEESERRGKHISAYRVRSSSDPDKTYHVIYHSRTASYYCDRCEASKHDRLCKHIKSVVYWTRYMVAWRGYLGMDDADLIKRDLDFARMERGLLIPYHNYHIDWDAVKSLLAVRQLRAERERQGRAA